MAAPPRFAPLELKQVGNRASQPQARDAEQRNREPQAQSLALNVKQTDRGMVVTIGGLRFETNRAQLKSGDLDNIEHLASFLKACPQRRFRSGAAREPALRPVGNTLSRSAEAARLHTAPSPARARSAGRVLPGLAIGRHLETPGLQRPRQSINRLGEAMIAPLVSGVDTRRASRRIGARHRVVFVRCQPRKLHDL